MTAGAHFVENAALLVKSEVGGNIFILTQVKKLKKLKILKKKNIPFSIYIYIHILRKNEGKKKGKK